jgi:hypothetical protein
MNNEFNIQHKPHRTLKLTTSSRGKFVPPPIKENEKNRKPHLYAIKYKQRLPKYTYPLQHHSSKEKLLECVPLAHDSDESRYNRGGFLESKQTNN